MTKNVLTVDDLKKESNDSSTGEFKKVNSVLKDVNDILKTVKDITGVNIFDKIKNKDNNSENVNINAKAQKTAEQTAQQIAKEQPKPSLKINSELARRDLIKRLDSVSDENTVKQLKEEIQELEPVIFDNVIEEWIKGVVTIE